MEAKIYHYIIPGDPIPLARPRHSLWKVYDAQKHLKFCSGINLRNLHGEKVLLSGKPLHLHVDFYLVLPKSWSSKKRDLMEGKYHYSKPDFSNLLKYIEDICTGIIYTDDALIAKVTGDKFYSITPRTEITITELL